MSAPECVFRFDSPGVSVEFEGPEDFVEAQIARLSQRIQDELAAAIARLQGESATATADAQQADANGDAGASPDAPSSLADFHRRARSREGRGAIQETILIFAYYLTEIAGRPEFGIDDLAGCFENVEAAPPSSLANTVGIMKRSQGFLEPGSRRGRYVLTTKGREYVRGLIGAQ